MNEAPSITVGNLRSCMAAFEERCRIDERLSPKSREIAEFVNRPLHERIRYTLEPDDLRALTVGLREWAKRIGIA